MLELIERIRTWLYWRAAGKVASEVYDALLNRKPMCAQDEHDQCGCAHAAVAQANTCTCYGMTTWCNIHGGR
jgi:hypothetical protein